MIRKIKHPDNRAARRALKFKKDFIDLKPKKAEDKEIPDDLGSEVSGSA